MGKLLKIATVPVVNIKLGQTRLNIYQLSKIARKTLLPSPLLSHPIGWLPTWAQVGSCRSTVPEEGVDLQGSRAPMHGAWTFSVPMLSLHSYFLDFVLKF